MYNYIIGEIKQIGENSIVVECNKIGYEMFVSTHALRNFDGVVGEIKIFTYYQVREDGVSLFGFYSEEEKEMFMHLISVSGVGPKGAIGILSNISASDLGVVIASKDIKTLSSVKGIGKKTAERLITELKDKINVIDMDISTNLEVEVSSEVEDAITVLASLGLTRNEALRIAKGVFAKGDSAEDIIRKSLSQIGS